MIILLSEALRLLSFNVNYFAIEVFWINPIWVMNVNETVVLWHKTQKGQRWGTLNNVVALPSSWNSAAHLASVYNLFSITYNLSKKFTWQRFWIIQSYVRLSLCTYSSENKGERPPTFRLYAANKTISSDSWMRIPLNHGPTCTFWLYAWQVTVSVNQTHMQLSRKECLPIILSKSKINRMSFKDKRPWMKSMHFVGVWC